MSHPLSAFEVHLAQTLTFLRGSYTLIIKTHKFLIKLPVAPNYKSLLENKWLRAFSKAFIQLSFPVVGGVTFVYFALSSLNKQLKSEACQRGRLGQILPELLLNLSH